MSDILTITILGSLVGILGTGLGGVIALVVARPNKRILSILLGFTSGIMMSVVTFDLVPEAIRIDGVITVIVGIVLGILGVMLVDSLLPEDLSGHDTKTNSSFVKSGILVGIGIALHNLPEGLAVGSSFMLTAEMGVKMALVITLHNVPEGIAMATPLRIGGFHRLRVVFLTLACGIPTGIGSFIGALLGNISSFFIALCLALAAGTMLFITCGELIPNAKTLHEGRASTIGVIAGFILGMIFASH